MKTTLENECRAVLEKACRVATGRRRDDEEYVALDDAAACMAEREAKLREALVRMMNFRDHNVGCEVGMTDFCTCGMKQAADAARAALAAAQENPDG